MAEHKHERITLPVMIIQVAIGPLRTDQLGCARGQEAADLVEAALKEANFNNVLGVGYAQMLPGTAWEMMKALEPAGKAYVAYLKEPHELSDKPCDVCEEEKAGGIN